MDICKRKEMIRGKSTDSDSDSELNTRLHFSSILIKIMGS